MAQARHALTERPEFPLEGLVEVDESYYGGRGPGARAFQ